jgi:HAD superfamily phosphatase
MKFKLDVTLIFDIDGVIRDVSGSYRRALADTVEHFTQGCYRPNAIDIDRLKSEGLWNNDWEASSELIRRYRLGSSLLIDIPFSQIVDFFQQRYRGNNWNGYIQDEPLIANQQYFQCLSEAGINWGFFSGASHGSASFVLDRLNIGTPVLVAMEDAPGKPDPTGLFLAIKQVGRSRPDMSRKVIYVGDTVADMLTVVRAREIDPSYQFLGVGVIPPHVDDLTGYGKELLEKGADLVLGCVLDLTPERIEELLR